MLEHRFGALLLSHVLTADPLPELGDGVTPGRVDFQASSYSAVDDLVVSGLSADGKQRRVSIGVRRDPSFVPSDLASVDLIASYLRVLDAHPIDVADGRWRLALVVASPNQHVRQLRELAGIARDVESEGRFRSEVSRIGRVKREIRERLKHFDTVVALAAARANIDTDKVSAGELSWRTLGALILREVRLEGVDESDRTIAVGRLRGVVQSGNADAADLLFSRLCELVGRYAPAAASKTIESLRRDLVGISIVGSSSRNEDGDITDVGSRPPMVRSSYLAQVRRIAPERLVGRDEELAELVEFSTAADAGQYFWWRAQAWAGKSALLSTFVLTPPDGVRIVSFFVTARWAGHADSAAFIEVVLEQVLELLAEPTPMLLTSATREAHLLDAFERAADLCRRRGERLVLVVDGLDEDSGVTTAPDAHSIAAVLPANPPAGMRVVVASRMNPPIPSDVPLDHPLRRPSIASSLAGSSHAEVVRQDAERELKRLLRGSAMEKDLLGLLAAAGGGLSELDLAQLTGNSTWEVQDQLRSVSARTFSSRSSHWQPQLSVYVLAHEEIQKQAEEFLGKIRLAEYRERIHEWAELYISKRWPANTPEYLLRGYFKLLLVARDVARLVNLGTDPDRHDRMLDSIGGDSAALSEILAVQEIVSAQPIPDLVSLSRLAVHRIKLAERNDHLPTHLPVVWSQLDRHSRAEALARSITAPARQVKALASVARHLAGSGDLGGARAVGLQAEQVVSSIEGAEEEASAYAVVARAAARTGDLLRARQLAARVDQIARSLPRGQQQDRAFIAAARSAAATGGVSEALAIARSIKPWAERSHALIGVATEVGEGGDWRRCVSIAKSISPRPDRAHGLAVASLAAYRAGAGHQAMDLARQARDLALAVRSPGRRAWIVAAVARELAPVLGGSATRDLLRDAEQAGRTETHGSTRRTALSSIAGVMALSGAGARAEELAREIDSPYWRSRTLAVVASGLAMKGERQHAENLAIEAELIARTVNGRVHVVRDQAALAQATASAGELSQAHAIALAIADEPQRDRTLTFVAEAIALAGDDVWADEVVASIASNAQRSKALFLLVNVAIKAGMQDRAERIARSIDDSGRRNKAIALLSITARDSEEERGDQNHARVSGASWEQASPEMNQVENNSSGLGPNPYRQFQKLNREAELALDRGDLGLAEQLVSSISIPALRVRSLMNLSAKLANCGNGQNAQELSRQALVIAREVPNSTHRDQIIAEIASRLADIDSENLDLAQQIVRSIENIPLRQRALGAVASAVAASGQILPAERIARTISDAYQRTKSLATIVEAAAQVGDLDGAERIARSIVDPLRRSRALGTVSRACAEHGDLEHARAVALSITSSSESARALTVLAGDFATESSRTLLARALSIGHWSICLPVLLRIEPAVVFAIGEEFLRASDHGVANNHHRLR